MERNLCERGKSTIRQSGYPAEGGLVRSKAGVVVVWLVPALTLILASCSGDRREAPTTVLIDSDPAFAERTLELAEELLAPYGLEVAFALPGEQPHITVNRQSEPGAEPFVTGYWVAAAALSSEKTDLTVAELHAGRLIVPVGQLPPFEAWWGGGTPDFLPVMSNEIARALDSDSSSIALMRLDDVRPGVKSLPVDGVDIVFGAGTLDDYPLVEQAWVSAAAHENADFALILDEAKDGLAKRLALDYMPPKPTILRATGDIIPARCVYAKQRDYGDFAHAFRELGPWLSQADITVGSLDASISDAGRPFGCTPTFSLLAPARSVEGLVYAGFDVMTVATNHVKDCGQDSCGDQAFFDTLDILRSNGIEPVGGGANLAEARAPAIIDVRGTTFAFLGYDEIAPYYHAGEGTAGVAPLTQAFLMEDIAALREQVDVIVVLPQWGVEYTNDPTETQRSRASVAVKAGADLVIGNHPHWVQAAEAFGASFVAYALGNFVFDQDWSIPTQQGVVLEAAFHGADLKGVRFHPIRIVDAHQPTFASVAEAQEILDRIWAASAALP